jgi:hypothetical protein
MQKEEVIKKMKNITSIFNNYWGLRYKLFLVKI